MQRACRIRAPLPAPADQLDSLLAYGGRGNARRGTSASLRRRPALQAASGLGSASEGVGGAPAEALTGLFQSGIHILNAAFAVRKPASRPAPGAGRPAGHLARSPSVPRLAPPGHLARSPAGSGRVPATTQRCSIADGATDAARMAPPGVTPLCLPHGGPPQGDRRWAARVRPRREQLRTVRGCWAGRYRRWRRPAWCSRGPARRAAPRWWRRPRGPGASPRPQGPRHRG